MSVAPDGRRPHRAAGAILHAAGFYDFTIWLMTFGRERAFRERLLLPARLRSGESVLDVGCGTGSLAIAAKRQVGAGGRVHGVDASPEMLGRAEKKAHSAGIDVSFGHAPAQALPFPDRSFDVALSSMMLHHLPRKEREGCLREIRRVLKPGGRMVAVEFVSPSREAKGFFAHLHRHGHVPLEDLEALLKSTGFDITRSGDVGALSLRFIVGTAA